MSLSQKPATVNTTSKEASLPIQPVAAQIMDFPHGFWQQHGPQPSRWLQAEAQNHRHLHDLRWQHSKQINMVSVRALIIDIDVVSGSSIDHKHQHDPRQQHGPRTAAWRSFDQKRRNPENEPFILQLRFLVTQSQGNCVDGQRVQGQNLFELQAAVHHSALLGNNMLICLSKTHSSTHHCCPAAASASLVLLLLAFYTAVSAIFSQVHKPIFKDSSHKTFTFQLFQRYLMLCRFILGCQASPQNLCGSLRLLAVALASQVLVATSTIS